MTRKHVTIMLHSNKDREQQTRDQLIRLLEQYPLDNWLFTTEVHIQSMVQPHSHPVLTLNTRQLDDDDGLLGTFLHEQFHWHAENQLPAVEAAIADFRIIWPQLPVGPPEGAKSEFSSYLHLIICLWEHQALNELIGTERGNRVIENRGYYNWIYQTAWKHQDLITSILKKHQLQMPSL